VPADYKEVKEDQDYLAMNSFLTISLSAVLEELQLQAEAYRPALPD